MRDEVDARLTAAFHDVPVPEGLAGRLLDRLAADCENGESDRPSTQCIFVPSETGVIRHKRRRLLAGSSLLTLAVALLVAVWLGSHEESQLSQQIVLDEAIRSFDAGFKGPGQLLSEKSAPKAYPLSHMVVRARGTRWQRVDDFLGRRGVAYELPGPSGTKAVLYVVEREVKGLDASPSLYPFTTAGFAASTWQEGKLLYVLVVEGDMATYKGYLNLRRNTVVLRMGKTYLNPSAPAGRRLS